MIAGAVIVFGTVFNEARATGRWETLEAIHSIENPMNVREPGRYGELGAYQFRAETWRRYTRLPFERALDRSCSDEVAVQHYEWLKAGLERNGIEASVYNIALAWNAGIGAVLRGRVPAASRDYATRVENIATELQARAPRLEVAFAH
jgi:hypothetical protein